MKWTKLVFRQTIYFNESLQSKIKPMYGFFEWACIKLSQHVFAFAETDTGADTVIIKARPFAWFFFFSIPTHAS